MTRNLSATSYIHNRHVLAGRPLPLGELIQQLEKLEIIFQPCLGPNSCNALLLTDSGQLIITADGRTLLENMTLSHPVLELAKKAALQYSDKTGDGCKEFVLLVTELLRCLHESMKEETAGPSAYSWEVECHARMRFSRSLQQLLRHHLSDVIFPQLTSHCEALAISSDVKGSFCSNRLKFALRGLFHAILTPKVTPAVRDILVSLLSEALFPSDEKPDIDFYPFKQLVHFYVDNFDTIFFKIPEELPSASRCVHPLIIERPLAFGIESSTSTEENTKENSSAMSSASSFTIPPNDSSKACAFALLVDCDIENVLDPNNEEQNDAALDATRELTSAQYIADAFLYRRMQNLVETLHRLSVRLILTTHKLSTTALSLCRKKKIYIVNHVPTEVISFLCKLTNCALLQEPSALDETSLAMHLVEFNSVKKIVLGGHSCTHVKLKHCKSDIRQILVSAPSRPLCHQYAQFLHGCFKAVLLSLQTSAEAKFCERTALPQTQSHQSRTRIPGGTVSSIPEDDKGVSTLSERFCEQSLDETWMGEKDLYTKGQRPSESSHVLRFIPAGVCFEFLAHHFLETLPGTPGNTEFHSTLKAVAQALIRRASLLHKNSNVHSAERSHFLTLTLRAKELIKSGKVPSMDPVSGRLSVYLGEENTPRTAKVALTSLPQKCSLLTSTLEFVIQLLRLEQIVAVRRIRVPYSS